MPSDWLSTNGWGTVDGVLATALCAFGAWIFHKAHRMVPRWFRVPVTYKAYGAIVIIFVAMYILPGQVDNRIHLITVCVGALILGFFMRGILGGYHSLGISTAYRSTEEGLGFEQSLTMATSSIDFLGIGAAKLTERTVAFDAAMKRCASGGKTVRLLLSDPSNPLLQTLAARNDISTDRYARNVRDSLRRIARLVSDNKLDIQVRFYPSQGNKDFKTFRLMFVDNKVCIWSWAIWDTTLGRNNPQVILLNKADGSSDCLAYRAFHDHFNRLWEDGAVRPADLSQYRGGE